jgi:hypothetical protein
MHPESVAGCQGGAAGMFAGHRFVELNPHYVRTAFHDRGYGRPSLRAVGSVRRNTVGAASSRDE